MIAIEVALELALSTHKGQVDKFGAPYILHPLRVAMGARTNDEMIVAILHDTVEDGDGKVTPATLAAMGFPDHIIAAVDCLSKRVIDGKEEPWEPYLDRVMTNSLAMRVKLLDLQDNLDVRRIPELTDRDTDRINRYLRAWRRITAELGNAETDSGATLVP